MNALINLLLVILFLSLAYLSMIFYALVLMEIHITTNLSLKSISLSLAVLYCLFVNGEIWYQFIIFSFSSFPNITTWYEGSISSPTYTFCSVYAQFWVSFVIIYRSRPDLSFSVNNLFYLSCYDQNITTLVRFMP